ncbi:MAG: pilin [Candidatus Paceibacterota bacterium]
MKKKLLILFSIALIVVPFFSFAAVQQDPSALLSGSGGGLVPQCEGAFCRACDLIELSSNVINFAIAFSVIIATLMFAYAGILYVTAASKPEQVKKAHGVFVNVFVGLCIVLTAWLLVNITFSVLTGRGLAIWSDIACVDKPTSAAFPDAPGAPTSRPPVTGSGTAVGTPISVPGNSLTNAEAVRRLEGAGVCGGRTGVQCLSSASLEGVKESTIVQAINLHNACRCVFTITSGTDGRHATGRYSHGNGFKLDIRRGPPLDAFVKSLRFYRHFDDFDGRGPGTYPADVYVDGCGNRYALEPTILDLQVTNACSY